MSFSRYQNPKSKLRAPAMLSQFDGNVVGNKIKGPPAPTQFTDPQEKAFYLDAIQMQSLVEVKTLSGEIFTGRIQWVDRPTLLLIDGHGKKILFYKTSIQSVTLNQDLEEPEVYNLEPQFTAINGRIETVE